MCRAAVLVLLLSLRNAAVAAMLMLYSPFDLTHYGHNGHLAKPQVDQPPFVTGDVLGGCGHGRHRDHATHQCRGPADLH